MDSYCLNFENTELQESLKDNRHYIYDGKRKTWIREHPEIVLEIDSQLRKYFDIKDVRKLVFSLYELKDVTRLFRIHDPKENVVNRIVISTSERDFKTNKGKIFHFNSWEAYNVPQKINDPITLYVDKIKANFRESVKTKTSEMVLVFEYMFNPKEFDNLLESLDYLNFY